MKNETNKTKVIHIYADPAHAWGKVKKEYADKMGAFISSYSYYHHGYYFLEEDCDLPKFVNALKENGITPIFKEHHTNKRSKIRNYLTAWRA